jgi:thiol-disulfide isomerase/thioredoxin
MTLATISGPEYYSGTNATFAADDGKARVWLVWAHWCPYCQAELPELEEWYPANAARFPNVELVTVTSAIDDTRDNPLQPYLDAEQFPFPVVVDETGSVSQLFGTTAFPFWVVTDSEGTVMLRVAGALDIASVDQIFAQLETMAAGSS